MRCLAAPDWIWQSRESVNYERLRCQQDDGDFDDREIFSFRQEAKRNNHGRCAGGRVVDVQQDHDGSGQRKRQCRRQNAGPIDFTGEPFWENMHARDFIGPEAAKQSDPMSQHGVPRAGGLAHWGKEIQICSRTQGGKDKGIVRQQSQQRQQCDCDEAIEGHVRGPDGRRGQVGEQPTKTKPVNQPEDVFYPMIRWGFHWMGTRRRHVSLDIREQIKVFVIFIDAAFSFA